MTTDTGAHYTLSSGDRAIGTLCHGCDHFFVVGDPVIWIATLNRQRYPYARLVHYGCRDYRGPISPEIFR